jgi:hypothetical protein
MALRFPRFLACCTQQQLQEPPRLLPKSAGRMMKALCVCGVLLADMAPAWAGYQAGLSTEIREALLWPAIDGAPGHKVRSFAVRLDRMAWARISTKRCPTHLQPCRSIRWRARACAQLPPREQQPSASRLLGKPSAWGPHCPAMEPMQVTVEEAVVRPLLAGCTPQLSATIADWIRERTGQCDTVTLSGTAINVADAFVHHAPIFRRGTGAQGVYWQQGALTAQCPRSAAAVPCCTSGALALRWLLRPWWLR